MQVRYTKIAILDQYLALSHVVNAVAVRSVLPAQLSNKPDHWDSLFDQTKLHWTRPDHSDSLFDQTKLHWTRPDRSDGLF